MTRTLEVTERTRVRRKPGRGSHERAVIDQILDEALVCHIAFVGHGSPVVLPTTQVRVGDAIYVHGSSASHMLRTLAGGVDISVAVTLLDGLVLSRTAFHHSVNYRSAVLFGRAVLVEDPVEKRAALAALVDKLVAGRSAACRPPNDAELAATTLLALPIEEASAKIRSGPPLADDGEDAALPFWAGVIPLHTTRGEPITAPDCARPFEAS
jgi:nitroimidazol reductase NimA-like FMN-containing flavoprotein (pyridoxamine 5'-phosphate oxidase superfamily)